MITFVHYGSDYRHRRKPTEEQMGSEYAHCELLLVSEGALKPPRDSDSAMVLGVVPGPCSTYAERTKDRQPAGYPRVSVGHYRHPLHLLLAEDVDEWSHHRRNWDDVRTLTDMRKEFNAGV